MRVLQVTAGLDTAVCDCVLADGVVRQWLLQERENMDMYILIHVCDIISFIYVIWPIHVCALRFCCTAAAGVGTGKHVP